MTLLAIAAASGAYAQGSDQIMRARLSGSRGDSGKCTIEVRVDIAAEVDIYGDSARLRTLGGQPSSWTRMECTDGLPTDMADFRFRGRDGRGSQTLIQDPRNNRGMAVVRIEDPKGGAEGYTFDIEWSGARGPAPTGGFPSDVLPGVSRPDSGLGRNGNARGRGNNRVSFEQAIEACRNEVLVRGPRDYNMRAVQVTGADLDRGQGRREWVTGTFTSRTGAMLRGGQYRFNCLVDYNTGAVRTFEIVRPDGSGLQPGNAYANQPRYDRNAVLRACQDAAVARAGRDGYRNVNFTSTDIDTRRNDTVTGVFSASRGPVGDTFDFTCTMDFNNANVRNVDLRRR